MKAIADHLFNRFKGSLHSLLHNQNLHKPPHRSGDNMAGTKSALPSHMKGNAMGNGEAASAFKRNHHGKSQSHMVS